ncbi:protein translocase subunit SecF [Candidatus Poribacteria bacterium]|nr:MAG: protein translocase subunit SecF [Candidatus Poribacteria bacterium]
MELLTNVNIDFLGKRKAALAISGLLILIGIVSIALRGLNLGIDFRGGAQIQVRFSKPVPVEKVKAKLAELGYRGIVTEAGRNTVLISIRHEEKAANVGRRVVEALKADPAFQVEDASISEVGPNVGKDLRKAAILSIIVSLIFLLGYISWRFEFRFAVGAILALVHDVLITLGFFSICAFEINLPTLAAFLTIIGYSLNDTIVVYDRIRENMRLLKGWRFGDIINRSINQTLSRTIITSLTTLLTVGSLIALSGPGEVRTFAIALAVGVIVGTYSSIFIASPIVYTWHLRSQRKAAKA